MTALLTHPLVKVIWASLLLALVGEIRFAQPAPWLTHLTLGIVTTAAWFVALASAGVLLVEVVRARQQPGGQR